MVAVPPRRSRRSAMPNGDSREATENHPTRARDPLPPRGAGPGRRSPPDPPHRPIDDLLPRRHRQPRRAPVLARLQPDGVRARKRPWRPRSRTARGLLCHRARGGDRPVPRSPAGGRPRHLLARPLRRDDAARRTGPRGPRDLGVVHRHDGPGRARVRAAPRDTARLPGDAREPDARRDRRPCDPPSARRLPAYPSRSTTRS